MRVNLLLTGNELMAGDIIDSNSAMIANAFTPLGWRIHKKVTVGDELSLLCEEIDSLSQGVDVLIINGGLGPTVDDMTASALAELTAQPLQQHPQALGHLTSWCERRGYQLNQANLKQTYLPAGAEIIANATGSAVGIQLQYRDCLVLATPGVPSELRRMLAEQILPLLKSRFASGDIHTTRLGVFGLGESGIQELIDKALPDWPADIELGFRASMPVLEVKLTSRHSGLHPQLATWQGKVEQLLGEHLIGPLPCSLASACLEALAKKDWQLVTAESCTGGLIASELTRVPGSSSHFLGGIVSYANSMKRDALQVSETSLEQYGAVSEEVAREMLFGALKKSGADLGVAVTGIAGPDGGSADKPVGTVWIAWGSAENWHTLHLRLPYERQFFQTMVAAISLDLLRRYCLGIAGIAQLARRYQIDQGNPGKR